MILLVTEPSVSGISDMERIIKTAEIFNTKIAICINKLIPIFQIQKKIEEFCRIKGISFSGKIPFDLNAVKASIIDKVLLRLIVRQVMR